MRTNLSDTDLDRAIDSLKGLRIGMTDASRHHLAMMCRQPRPRFWEALLPGFETLRLHRLPVAAGAMAFLLVGDRVPSGTTGYGNDPVRLVNVVPAGPEGVTLEWRDGPRRTYTVLKSTDPRNFRGAESYAVKGNRWTDSAPAAGEVVYYRVE